MKLKELLSKLNSKWKIISAIFGVFVLTASIGVGVYLSQKEQKTKVGAAGVNLTLTSSNATPKVGGSFVVAITMNTQGQNVSATDVTVDFDATKLTATGVQVGTFLPFVFTRTGIANPLISGSSVNMLLGAPGVFSYVNGTGLVAQINFKAIAAGATTITLDPKTIVSVQNQTTSQTGALTPVSVTISPPTTPTPVATKTPTPRPTPTSTPIASKTPTPTPGQIICGGIAAKTCLPNYRCVYPPGSPLPDQTGNCVNGTPTPKPTTTPTPTGQLICGGIAGKTCPPSYRCVYPAGTPYPDQSGLCQSGTPTPKPTPTKSPSPAPTPAMCGGIAGKTCPPNYRCVYPPGSPFPDQSGTCTKGTPTPKPQTSCAINGIRGDVDGDCHVTIVDVGILVDNYGLSPIPNPNADVDKNGSVDIVDIGILVDNYGK